MNFQSQEFLKNHIFKIVNFYIPKCIDQERGVYKSIFWWWYNRW